MIVVCLVYFDREILFWVLFCIWIYLLGKCLGLVGFILKMYVYEIEDV